MTNETKVIEQRIVQRLIKTAADYEEGGSLYSQVIPLHTQAYAIYDSQEKSGLYYVFGDGVHTYTEIRDGQSSLESSHEYAVFDDAWIALVNSKADLQYMNFELAKRQYISNLVNEITEENKKSTTLYPSVKAVSTLVDTLQDALSDEITRAIAAEGSITSNLNTHVNNTENPHNVTKEQLDLENVDNTSDLDKPISMATQEALDKKEDKVNAYDTIKREKAYLYTTTYSNLDYNFAKRYFEERRLTNIGGACSSIRNGNFYGRNFDWIYSEQATLIIKTPRMLGRYATMGVAGAISGLTDAFIKTREYSEAYKIAPFMLLDGINEKGVVVNTNVVPTDYGVTTEVIPYGTKEDTICAIMLPRYILDNFATALEAVQYIREHVATYMPKLTTDMGYELHVMVADENETYVVEFINNRTSYVKLDGTNAYPIMTNFYLHKSNGTDLIDVLANKKVYTPADVTEGHLPSSLGISQYGAGLERYNILVDGYSTANSLVGMTTLMNSIKYTNTYRDPTGLSDVWYSEFTHVNGLTVDSTPAQFTPTVQNGHTYFVNRSRDPQSPYFGTWQTTHSCVYDITNKKLYIITQEDGIEYTYDFDYYTKEEIDVKVNTIENTLTHKQDTLVSGSNIKTINDITVLGSGNVKIETHWQAGEGEGAIVTKASFKQGGQATGNYSVAEGFGSDAKGDYSHAEGQLTTTNGGCAHAEGQGTTAQGNCSHAEGIDTIAQNQSEHAEGQYNKSNKTSTTFGNAGNTIHSIGIGTGAGSLEEQDRRNAFEIMQNGDAYLYGVGSYNGKNFNEADTLQDIIKNTKAYKAFPDDFVTEDSFEAFVSSIETSSGAATGATYLGGIYGNWMPWGEGNAECKVEYMGDDIALLTISSSDIAPYHWEYNTMSGNYKWKYCILQTTTMDIDAYIDGIIVQYVGETDEEYTNGYFYKSLNSRWQQINIQPAAPEVKSATEAPLITTAGELGQLYIDTVNQTAYICVGVNDTDHEYVWKAITLS